jgi:hypothetical protein
MSIFVLLVYYVLITKKKEIPPIQTNLLVLNCKNDISECENPLKKGSNIKLITGPLARISYSLEDINNGSERDYYFYIPYDFIVSFIIEIQSGNVIINSVNELDAKLNIIDEQFIKPRMIPIIFDNVQKKIRNSGVEPYNTTCFFYNLYNIGDISSLIQKSILPKININILQNYFNNIQKKINETNTITLFEYIMYITINNYIDNKNIKYVIQKM